jgi:hypothetical protein
MHTVEHVRLVLHEVRVEVEYFQPHVPAHLEPSYHTVVPRTLHHDLYETWVSVIVPPVLEHTHVQAPLCRLVLRLLSVSTGPIGLVLAALSKE